MFYRFFAIIILIPVILLGCGESQPPTAIKTDLAIVGQTTTPSVLEANDVVIPANADMAVDNEVITPKQSLFFTEVANDDSDQDGLSDSLEASLATNPLSADTDNDGLTDFAEQVIYKSNPLLADTDGDGYDDGTEVLAGYDPLVVGGELNSSIGDI